MKENAQEKINPPSQETENSASNSLIRWRKGYIRDRIKGERYEGRSKSIAQLKVGDKVRLRREPQNKYDKNAIRVETLNGHELGYLDRDLAKRIVEAFEEYGEPVFATIIALTGGFEESGTHPGALIEFKGPDYTDQEPTVYLENRVTEPIQIYVAGSERIVDLLSLPKGQYKLINRQGRPVAERLWDPSSPGLIIIWKSLIKAGFQIILE